MASTSFGKRATRFIVWLCGMLLATAAAITAIEFPYDVDAPLTKDDLEKEQTYYAEAYHKTAPTQEQSATEYETRYMKLAAAAAEESHISDQVRALVERYGLEKKPVLEIGAGRGNLQDIVENYTGLDISASVARFYHKKFVVGSATALPFPDNSFEGSWSIWVLEHIPNPEQSLREWRRVMRDAGTLLLFPAWSSTTWAANGYRVRPYSDFNFAGKVKKALIPIRSSWPYRAAERVPMRLLFGAAGLFGGPTRLHYTRLIPNYKEYWEEDSDAVNSLDRYLVMQWFRSRGDECLNCSGKNGSIFMSHDPWLIIRVHKR
jgi:ubiquinone/menaquinone biosynthesis C-methylase UbiE